MVFPSVPLYLDPPSWNQQPQQVHNHGSSGGGGDGGGEQHLQLQQVPAPPQPRPDGSGGMAGSVRLGSMADRARLAKIPQPEPALKCPRCESTNTKFCYFNNYSLSQPRHFCKTCRRYWTRGGALRNVPVGGGCRRNKRSKSAGSGSSSKSTSAAAATAADRQAGTSSASTATSAGAVSIPAPAPQLPFMTSLHPIMDYGTPNIGLGFAGMQSMDGMDYSVAAGSSSSMGLEQWRLNQIQQFPFLGGLEPQLPQAPVSGLYPFDGQLGGGVDGGNYTGKATASELISQLASVKMEDSSRAGMNLARQYLGAVHRNDQFWGGSGGGSNGGGSSSGGGWMTDLSGFNSSSTGSLL